MTMKAQQYTQLNSLAALLRSLGDANRLNIIRTLAKQEARVADLVAGLPLAQSTISAHIACLKGCGLIKGRAEGRQVYYSLVSTNLTHLLFDAEQLLEQTDSGVDSCPVFGGQE